MEDAKDTNTYYQEPELERLKETKSPTTKTTSPSERTLTEEEMKKIIGSYDPPAIKDWPKIPYKTIFIILLLLSSSILFLFTAHRKFKENEKWTIWLSYYTLGTMLIIPGGYYSFFLINILIGTPGYEYSDLPDLSET